MDREVLSDVHTFNNYEIIAEKNTAVTRFEFKFEKTPHKAKICTKSKPCTPTKDTDQIDIPCAKKRRTELENAADSESDVVSGNNEKSLQDPHDVDGGTSEANNTAFDDEGDFVGRRKPVIKVTEGDGKESSNIGDNVGFINIKHHLVTDLKSVGEQVWLGALLLCDYILDNYQDFVGQTVVDLGSGTGLTSIIAGLFAERVFCTDTGKEILQLAHENVESAKLYPSLPLQLGQIQVRELDWFKGVQEDVSCMFGLSKDDVRAIQTAPIVIAADVVYDNAITDAFFDTVWGLLEQPTNTSVYMGLEKRLVFTIEDLDVSSPGYEHFRRQMDNLHAKGKNSNIEIHVSQIPADFKKYFHYTRTKQLELWKIWTVRDVT